MTVTDRRAIDMSPQAGFVTDMIEEVPQIIDIARNDGFPIRVIGGLAVKLRCPYSEHQSFRQACSDADLAVYSKHVPLLNGVMASFNYQPNLRFNALFGETRLLFEKQPGINHFDIFVDNFKMCHKLSLKGRLELDDYTIALSDLTLSKLQIVEMNEKDVLDLYSLIITYDLSGGPSKKGIDVQHIAQVCRSDWGWYRTVRDNLNKLISYGSSYLKVGELRIFTERVERLIKKIDEVPKSPRWMLRSLIGDLIVWYEIPEEPSTSPLG